MWIPHTKSTLDVEATYINSTSEVLCGRLHVESTSEVVLMYVDSTSKVDFVCGIHIQSGKWDVEKTWIPHTYVENMSSQQKKLAS